MSKHDDLYDCNYTKSSPEITENKIKEKLEKLGINEKEVNIYINKYIEDEDGFLEINFSKD